MALPNEPLRSIFPIIKINIDKIPNPSYRFIGTGFFIDKNGNFLTAKHVFEFNPLSPGEQYGIVILPDGLSVYPVSDFKLSESYDIALGKLQSQLQNIQPLEISTENQPMNHDVLTVEYSSTSAKKLKNGKLAIHLRPSFRKGNVISYYKSDYPEDTPIEALELSFPALKGASGAPVVIENSGLVVGMIIQNIEKELLPAHTEKIVVENEGKLKEQVETKYYLPNGKAISWRHLLDFIK